MQTKQAYRTDQRVADLDPLAVIDYGPRSVPVVRRSGVVRWYRISRGALGIALAWCMMWSLLAVLPVMRYFTQHAGPHDWTHVIVGVFWPGWRYAFTYGAVVALCFSVLLRLVGRRTGSVSNLSVLGVGALGACAAAAPHVYVIGGVILDPYVALSALLG